MRPLVFKCPVSNLRVLTDLRLSDAQRRSACDMAVRIECPCGVSHAFTVAEALPLTSEPRPTETPTIRFG